MKKALVAIPVLGLVASGAYYAYQYAQNQAEQALKAELDAFAASLPQGSDFRYASSSVGLFARTALLAGVEFRQGDAVAKANLVTIEGPGEISADRIVLAGVDLTFPDGTVKVGELSFDKARLEGVPPGSSLAAVSPDAVAFDTMTAHALSLAASDGATVTMERVGIKDFGRGRPSTVTTEQGVQEKPADAERITFDRSVLRGFHLADALSAAYEGREPEALLKLESFEVDGLEIFQKDSLVGTVEKISAGWDIRPNVSQQSTLSVRGYDALLSSPAMQEKAEPLVRLGYSRLALDVDLAVSRDDRSGATAVGPLTVAMRDAGTLTISANLNKVPSPGAGDSDALAAVEVADLTLAYRDQSLLTRMLSSAAQERKISEEALVKELLANIGEVVAGPDSDPATAEARAAALSDFLKTRGELRIVARPDAPVPVAQVAMMAMLAPQQLPALFNVQFTSSK